MKWLYQLWNLLSNLGITRSLTLSETRRVRTLNRIAFIGVLVCSPYIDQYIKLNAPLPVLVQILTVCLLASIWLINHLRWYQLARYLFIASCCINIFVTTDVFGLASGEILAIFPVALFVFLIFSPRQRLDICLGIGVTLAPLIFCGLLGIDLLGTSESEIPFGSKFIENAAAALIACMFIGYYFQKLSDEQLTDVTKRSQQELQALFDNAFDAVLLADRIDMRILEANVQARQTFTNLRTEGEKNIRDLFGPSISELILSKTKEEQKWSAEFEVPFPDGHVIWADIACSLVTVSGDDRLLIRMSDISKRKAAEEALVYAKDKAEEATVVKSQFLSTMSHEIRTPMNAVIGLTGLLLETHLNEEQKEFTETIRLSGENLLSVINDILDFSKIESGKMELEQYDFCINEPVEDVMDILSLKAHEKGIELLYWIDPAVPPAIVADQGRLRQVLLNLGSNALKFTEKGEILISVHLIGVENGMHRIRFSIKDTGIGIPDEKKHRLFQSFSQVDASTTRKYGGTGLGLAICKNLVGLMGGEMWVESSFGLGSTFYFTMLAPAGDVSNIKDHLSAAQSPGISGGSVLIVDDNATNLMILERQCQQLGLEVVACADPRAVAEILEMRRFDLGILDMQMPEMDGLTLAQNIRQTYSAKQLPLILLSSVTYSNTLEMSRVFNATLSKPARRETLTRIITQCLLDRNICREQPEISAPVVEVPERAKNQQGIRILLAEDNPVNQKVALKILEKLGYKADVAANGAEAVTAVELGSYDLVFMDIQMPEMDGLSATREIRRRLSSTTTPVIIAMTANAMAEDRVNCLGAGMNDYLSKPIKKEQVEEMLEKWKTLIPLTETSL